MTRAMPQVYTQTNEYNDMKVRLHGRLLDLLDLPRMSLLDQVTLQGSIRKALDHLFSQGEFVFPLNAEEREQFYREMQDEVLGLGPIEPFLHDPTVTDVLVNTYNKIYVERGGKLKLTLARFKDDAHLKKIIDRIVAAVGRRIDESCPMVDARLADGSRVNAIIPPLAIDGPILSIRRFSEDPLEIEDLISLDSISPEIAEFVKGIVKARLNILISGGTGTGKTTLLNVLSRFIPNDERIVTIEDSAELQLKQEHVVRLETRPPNIEGAGEITQRDLVRNSLRMRPDRIIVGEVRGSEVLDMLQAMNTGHDGSLTTVHANSPRDALARLETLTAMSGLNIPNEAVRKYVSSALDVIVHVARLMDGSRKMVSFQEVLGMDENTIIMQEIFRFEQTGVDARGRVEGSFHMQGVVPRFFDKFKVYGVTLPYDMFEVTKAGLTRRWGGR